MIRVVLTTFANSDDAARVVRMLVEEKLAACGTLLPGARSIYSWQGKIEDSAEAVVLMKTTASKYESLRERLLALHPYETPEIIALDPSDVAPKYADWLTAACS